MLTCTSLVIRADGVYVGGRFSTAGSIDAENVARWDGSTWYVLKNSTETLNGVNSNIYALAADSNAIYMGGYFTSAGENTANHIAAFASGKWNSLGDSVSGIVRELYHRTRPQITSMLVGVSNLPGVLPSSAWRVGIKSTKTWERSGRWSWISAAARGLIANPRYERLSLMASNMYIGGNFTSVGGTAVKRIARYNLVYLTPGQTWEGGWIAL